MCYIFKHQTNTINEIIPLKYRKRLRTTNGIWRLNKEIRQRKRVIRIFPNEESVVRLIGALLIELDEK